MLKIVQGCKDPQLGLTADSRLASRQSWHMCEACWGAEESCQLLHYRQKSQAGQAVSSWLSLVTRPSRQTTLFGKHWLFAFLSHPIIYRPLYSWNIESFQREFWERNPREKQDWFIHNLHMETLQIPLLSSSPLLHPWEVHYQNLFSPYPYLWEGHLVLWEKVKKGPISYRLMLWSSSGIR